MHDTTHPNEVGRDAGRKLLIRRQLLVGRRRRVYHQRLRIAHVRKVTRQLERVDDFGAHRRVLAALHPEAQHATECVGPERLECQLVRGVRLEAGVGDPGDLLASRGTARARARCRSGAARGARASPDLAGGGTRRKG